MRSRILAIVLPLFTLGAVALAPSSAQAAAPNCPAGFFCAWKNTNFEGGRKAWYGSDGFWDNDYYDNGAGVVGESSSSWQNNGVTGPGVPADVQIYDGYFGTGKVLCVWNGAAIAIWSGWDNVPNSHYWRHDC